jgi:uncharacterized protein (TIGR00290 family)
MKILLSWSSGKDSAWTLHVLNRTYPGCVAALLTTVNEAFDRVAMHGVRSGVLRAQARAARLPVRVVALPDGCSNDTYDRLMGRTVDEAVADGFTHVAFGDLFLRDIRAYREQRLSGTGLTPLFPLWDLPTAALARDMIDAGLRARISCVDTRTLDASFAGREFDAALLRELPDGIDPCGENGEFHTCVYAGPMFDPALPLETGERMVRDPFVWSDYRLADEAPSSVMP